MEGLVDYYRSLVSSVVAGRRVVLCFGTVVGAAVHAKALKEAGAYAVAVIADSVCTGPDPEEGTFDEIIMVDVTARSVMDAVRGYQAALLNLSPEAAAALDRFDPAGDALVMPAIWQTDGPVGGRPVYGGRPEEWRRLEDKILVAGLLEAAGIVLAPYEIVDLASADFLSVHLRLDRGMGTVWVADNREGWHGGGEMMRWARSATELDRAVRFLSGHADRARAMPFLDGIPCSIHGLVTPDHVVSGRPVEMVVLRSPDGLRYCGAATSWMAKEDDEAAMRAVAERAGAHLRREVGFRGTFTVDGVMTRQGFRPTELNPRYGAGLGVLVRGLESLPLGFVNLMVAAGEDFDWRAEEFEKAIIDVSRRNTVPAAGLSVVQHRGSTQDLHLRWEGSMLHVGDEQDSAGTISLGPSSMGGYLRMVLSGAGMPAGVATAPHAARAFQLASDHWDLDLPRFTAAADVCREAD